MLFLFQLFVLLALNKVEGLSIAMDTSVPTLEARLLLQSNL